MGRRDFGAMAGWGDARIGRARSAGGTHYTQPVARRHPPRWRWKEIARIPLMSSADF